MDIVPGCAVISNSHLLEVGRLLYPRDEADEVHNASKSEYYIAMRSSSHLSLYPDRLTTIRIFDLLTLTEALVLNEKLYTLPAAKYTTDNTLWKTLKENKIIKTVDPDDKLAKKVTAGITENLMQVTDYQKIIVENKRLNFEDKQLLSILSQRYSNSKFLKRNERHAPGEISHKILESTSKEQVLQNLKQYYDNMNFQSSIQYEDCSSFIRDMFYIFSAEALGMPYHPQLLRRKFSQEFPNYYNKSFKTKLFSIIAKALDSKVSELFDDFGEKAAYIPPFSSIVLSRSKKPEDILDNILQLRQEFKKTRRGFQELEMERAESKNLKERNKIAQRMQLLLKDAAKSFEDTSIVNLTATLKYIPEVIKPITAPHDITKYSSNLLLQPIDLILEWWRKRPVSKMYSLQRKVMEIKNYEALIQKVFHVKDLDYRWDLY